MPTAGKLIWGGWEAGREMNWAGRGGAALATGWDSAVFSTAGLYPCRIVSPACRWPRQPNRGLHNSPPAK